MAPQPRAFHIGTSPLNCLLPWSIYLSGPPDAATLRAETRPEHAGPLGVKLHCVRWEPTPSEGARVHLLDGLTVELYADDVSPSTALRALRELRAALSKDSFDLVAATAGSRCERRRAVPVTFKRPARPSRISAARGRCADWP